MHETVISYDTYLAINSKAQLGLLSQAIITCMNRAFGYEMPREEVDDALIADMILTAITTDREVVGFASMEELPEDEINDIFNDGMTKHFYLKAAAVTHEFQSHGVYHNLTKARIEYALSHGAIVISTTTQNPKVEKGISKVLDECISSGKIAGYRIERDLLIQYYGRRLTKYKIDT